MPGRATRAVDEKDFTTLRRLRQEGEDLNRLDADGRTPLMHAVMGPQTDPGMVQFLLDLGADPNVRDRLLGWTALHYAVRDHKVEIVEALLRGGANADEADVFGDTPLWRCVTGTPPSVRIMRLLVQWGADPSRAHPMGISARDIAESLEQRDLVAALA